MGGCEGEVGSQVPPPLAHKISRGQYTGETPTCPWDVFNLWRHLGAYQTEHWEPTWRLESPSACLSRPQGS